MKRLIKILRKAFAIHVVISSSGKSFLIEDVELVDKGLPVKNVCRGCLFLEKDFTCKYTERLKMPMSCMDVDTPSNYQPKNYL